MYWKKIVFSLLALLGLAMLALSIVKPLFESAFEMKKQFDIALVTKSGASIETHIIKRNRGFFVDGGHGFSFGGTDEIYEMDFQHEKQTIKWSGSGMPFNLQMKDHLLYFVVFDRKSDLKKPEFKCFQWDTEWRSQKLKDFPKELATNNLLELDDTSSLPFYDERFRESFLAIFWFCIANDLQFWQVEPQQIKRDFTDQYQARWMK